MTGLGPFGNRVMGIMSMTKVVCQFDRTNDQGIESIGIELGMC